MYIHVCVILVFVGALMIEQYAIALGISRTAYVHVQCMYV